MDTHSLCSQSNTSIYHDTSAPDEVADLIHREQFVRGYQSSVSTSKVVNKNTTTSMQPFQEDLLLHQFYARLESLLLVHSNKYNYETVMSRINIICNMVDTMNNFRFLQWNGNVVREEGGICNAPFKQRKDSICYFFQLLYSLCSILFLLG